MLKAKAASMETNTSEWTMRTLNWVMRRPRGKGRGRRGAAMRPTALWACGGSASPSLLLEDLPLVGAPGEGPLVWVLERLETLHPVDGLRVRRVIDELRLRVGLVGRQLDDRGPLVEVVLAVGLARLRRERLGHHPRVVAHPEALDAEVDHAVAQRLGADAGVFLELLQAVAHLVEPAVTFSVRPAHALDGHQQVVEVVVVEHADLGDFLEAFGPHAADPGVGADDAHPVAVSY